MGMGWLLLMAVGPVLLFSTGIALLSKQMKQ
jgi:hypothetical protein